VIKRLNPIIRGWAAYYRTQVSGKTFKTLDHYLWKLTYRWALLSHRNKSRPWVFARYFGKFNRSRLDRWVFGDRASGAHLHRFAWTGIVRHQMVRYRASPDDPELADYWAWRRRKAPLPINHTRLRLLEAQDGRCTLCKGTLYAVADQPQLPHEWERWLVANNAAIITITTQDAGATDKAERRLIHADCTQHSGTAPCPPTANKTRPSRMR
jgi:RNA-directed DNA polymerase